MTAKPEPTVIRMLLELACRAPSVHNSQPWRWVNIDGSVDLYADRRRMLKTIDPLGRQLAISCGAAVDHLRTGATAFRWDCTVDELPLDSVPKRLAAIDFVHSAHPRSHDFDLLTAIHRRRSDRRAFGPLADIRAVSDRMWSSCERHRTTLNVLSDNASRTLAEASELSAAVRRYDSTYQAELRLWAGHSLPEAGIPSAARTGAVESSRVALARRFPEPRATEEDVPDLRDERSGVDEATVVLLSTETDSTPDWLRCGQALSAVLLEATVDGHASCALTHLTEQSASRALIESLAPGCGVPQVLIRIGRPPSGPPLPATPRLQLSSVLTDG